MRFVQNKGKDAGKTGPHPETGLVSGRSSIRAALHALADLLSPPCCLACGQILPFSALPLLCADCQAQLRWIEPPLCACCGLPGQEGRDQLCQACRKQRPAFALARSPLLYGPPLREALLHFKFHHDFAWLPSLAALCRASALLADLTVPDWILPVPLHLSRLRERGFNQSLLLARACFPAWRSRIRADLLLRTRSTVPQSSLDGAARRSNLHAAFAVPRKEDVRGKSLLLVDDVFTTGTTVQVCAEALQQAGALRVEVFTPARSVPWLLKPGSPLPAPGQSQR